jgi:oligoribonuclease
LIWTDIETTGLDKNKEVLLEVGFRVTDLDLNEMDYFHAIVWMPHYDLVIDNAVKFVLDMHTKNGLLTEAQLTGETLDVVAARLGSWLSSINVDDEPLCGSSVQFDREWLTHLFPNVMSAFSHRNIDVSTVKELCKRFNPILASKLEEDVVPQKMHRVNPDITDTIEEFEFYRDNFLFWHIPDDEVA